MKSEIIKQFNNIVESFLNQLVPLIGSKYLFYFRKFIKFNSIAPIKNFIYYTNDHKDKILSRDESYFQEKKNWTSEVRKLNNAEYYFSEIFRMNQIWDKLNKNSKKIYGIFFKRYCIYQINMKTIAQQILKKILELV